jgi:hypothetical protein
MDTQNALLTPPDFEESYMIGTRVLRWSREDIYCKEDPSWISFCGSCFQIISHRQVRRVGVCVITSGSRNLDETDCETWRGRILQACLWTIRMSSWGYRAIQLQEGRNNTALVVPWRKSQKHEWGWHADNLKLQLCQSCHREDDNRKGDKIEVLHTPMMVGVWTGTRRLTEIAVKWPHVLPRIDQVVEVGYWTCASGHTIWSTNLSKRRTQGTIYAYILILGTIPEILVVYEMEVRRAW